MSPSYANNSLIEMSAQQFYFNPAHVFDSKNPDYTTWYNRVVVELAAYGCLQVALGQETRPVTADEQVFFDVLAANAKKIIMNTVDSTIARMGNGDTTAADILTYMRKMYEKRHQHSIFDAREQFVKLKYKEGSDMAFHIRQVQVLADELTRADRRVDDVEKSYQLLTSLPDSWKQVRHRCLDGETVDWEVIQSKVLSAHRSRSTKTSDVDAGTSKMAADSAMFAQGNAGKRRHVQAFGGGSNGGRYAGRKKGKWSKPTRHHQSNKPSCAYCSKDNHTEPQCRLKRRHDAERNQHQRPEAAMAVMATPAAGAPTNSAEWMLAVSGVKRDRDGTTTCAEWVVDSGATSHICKHKYLFSSLRASSASVTAANDAALLVHGVGTAVVWGLSVSGDPIKITLENRLYVPSVAKNLLSVRKLKAARALVDFDKYEDRVAITLEGRTLLSAANGKKLYSVSLHKSPTVLNCAEAYMAALEPTLELWHQRLGHISADSIKNMAIMSDGTRRPGLHVVNKQ
jgi:hypothetical protein